MSDKKPRTKAAPPRDASAPLSTNADVHEGAAASVAVQVVPIGKLKANPKNPRVLRDEKFAKLKKSLTDFPDMLNKRPLVGVTDTDGKIMVLGGNMRLRAMQDLGIKTAPVMLADHWTEEQRLEFIIKDNVGFGEWNWDDLANEWNADDLSDWGLDVPEESATAALSDASFVSPYYEPENQPDVDLTDCIDLDLFDAKMAAITESKLPDDKKEALRWMAYRFIRIDFERVADYFAHKADEDEKRVMERLRLVLVDGGSVEGFIEDDMLRVVQDV